MTFLAYLADRAMIIASWLIGTVLVVVTLAVSGANSLANALYALGLSVFVTAVALGVDYYRQRPYYAQLAEQEDALMHPALHAKTREQHLVAKQFQRHNAALHTALANEH